MMDPEQSSHKVDGALVCCECEQVIPGGEFYYELPAGFICRECMDTHEHVAPFRGEWW